ncbi:MAG: hypothetical protein P8N50_06535 [Actinomycetota bacterium]|jgi:hypothetical protein|nr:hypothetical protein [Actinomycetota bacterium]
MGQPVRVVEKSSVANPGVVRFETNRPLSGMGHRMFLSGDDVTSDTDPADVLATKMFDRGGIDSVHVNGSVITVDLAKGQNSEGIEEMIASMFLHY